MGVEGNSNTYVIKYSPYLQFRVIFVKGNMEMYLKNIFYNKIPSKAS